MPSLLSAIFFFGQFIGYHKTRGSTLGKFGYGFAIGTPAALASLQQSLRRLNFA